MSNRENEIKQMKDFRAAKMSDPVTYRVDVTVTEDAQTGVEAVMEFWENEDGQRDRPFGPAFVATSVEHGTVFRQEWFSKGSRHREDGPAILVTDPETGSVIDERYYHEGDQYYPTIIQKNNPGAPPGLT